MLAASPTTPPDEHRAAVSLPPGTPMASYKGMLGQPDHDSRLSQHSQHPQQHPQHQRQHSCPYEQRPTLQRRSPDEHPFSHHLHAHTLSPPVPSPLKVGPETLTQQHPPASSSSPPSSPGESPTTTFASLALPGGGATAAATSAAAVAAVAVAPAPHPPPPLLTPATSTLGRMSRKSSGRFVRKASATSRTLSVSSSATSLGSTAVHRRKIVVLGDGTVGKTCLLAHFSTGTFPQRYVPTVFENVLLGIEIDGRRLELAVWDTAGQEDYARLRPLAYPDTDAFILCFAINQRESFSNALTKWMPEIRHYCPDTPVLLVGLKSDLRHSTLSRAGVAGGVAGGTGVGGVGVGGGCLKVTEAEDLVVRGLVSQYRECSALSGDGVVDAMEAAARLAIMPRRRQRRRAACLVL